MRPMNARRGDDGSSRDALKPLELRLDRHNMPLVLLLVTVVLSVVAKVRWGDLGGGPAALPRDGTCAGIAAYEGPRVVVVGDVRGDAAALIATLRAAGLVGERRCDEWRGGRAVLVQTGNVVGHGPDWARAHDCLRGLQRLAAAAGGRVVRLAGNHELLWAEGRFHHAHADDGDAARAAAVADWKDEHRAGAVAAAHAAGPYLFTHAGLRPAVLAALGAPRGASAAALARVVNERLAVEVEACAGRAACAFGDALLAAGPDRGGSGVGGPFWTDFGVLEAANQDDLPEHLVQVVGHTAAACDAKRRRGCAPVRHRADLAAVVVDAGMSRALHGNRAYLEIVGGAVRARWLARHRRWAQRDLAAPCRRSS